METIHVDDTNLEYWQSRSRKNVMALGFFDGVHKGHQKVIGEAKREAEKNDVSLDVMSFFPHPKTVISNGKKRVEYLMPLEEKASVLEKMGVDRFYIVKFTKAFASMEPREYVEEYLEKLGTIQAVAGYDFSYGFKGEGNMDRLAADSDFSIGATKVDKVAHMGSKISSTCIRTAILEGRISELSQLLGRKYTTKARMKEGHLSLYEYYMLPGDGIYNVTIDTDTGRYQAQIYVDGALQKVIFTGKCPMKQIGQQEITITWERRIASYTFNQLVVQ